MDHWWPRVRQEWSIYFYAKQASDLSCSISCMTVLRWNSSDVKKLRIYPFHIKQNGNQNPAIQPLTRLAKDSKQASFNCSSIMGVRERYIWILPCQHISGELKDLVHLPLYGGIDLFRHLLKGLIGARSLWKYGHLPIEILRHLSIVLPKKESRRHLVIRKAVSGSGSLSQPKLGIHPRLKLDWEQK